jgi:hypothetical protein
MIESHKGITGFKINISIILSINVKSPPRVKPYILPIVKYALSVFLTAFSVYYIFLFF